MIAFAITAAAPTAGQGFVETTATAGLSLPPTHNLFNGRGACFGDFDGDGDQDLIYPRAAGAVNTYYENQGNGTFIDRTVGAGLGISLDRPHAVIAADIDNDGDLDVFMPGHFESNRMYLNDGTGVFTEVAASRGLTPGLRPSFTASFGYYDRDGWIDLYVGNYTSGMGVGDPNQLFRNLGNGTFQDVTATAGAADPGLCFTGIFHDYNDDGWPDIFVGNDKGWYPGLSPDTTYRNNGDGTFTDVGAAINTQFGIGAMGADFTDAFNDGGWDIFVSNVSAGHVFHVWNPLTLQYDESAVAYGVVAYIEGWATNFFDYDNDGWQDLYVVHSYVDNALFKNPGPAGGLWTDQGAALGCGNYGSTKYSCSIVDYDNDGHIDIFNPRPNADGVLYRNTGSTNNWLRLRLEGTRSNRSAIGAKVSVTVGTNTTRQSVRTGHGYLGGHDLRLHFGAATAATVDSVFIEWPSGQTQYLLGLATNQEHHIIEPSLEMTGTATPGATIGLDLTSALEPNAAYLMGLTGGTTGFSLSDGRVVPADPDWLLTLSTTAGNPLLPTPSGALDATGFATSPMNVPALPVLSGLSFYAAGAIALPAAPVGISTIVGPTRITIQ